MQRRRAEEPQEVKRVLLLIVLAIAPAALAQTHWNVSLVGGRASMSWHGNADLRSLNLEMTRAISPRTDVAFVLSPTLLDQPRSWFGDQYGDGSENVRALGGYIFLRRRIGSAWYVETGTGPMYAEKAVPASTSRFNFATQAGAGYVFRSRLTIGYRFQHISNGGYSPRNPGMNVSAVVLGFRLR